MSVTAKAVLFAEADPATAAGDSPGWRGTLQRLGTPLAAASAAAKATVEVVQLAAHQIISSHHPSSTG